MFVPSKEVCSGAFSQAVKKSEPTARNKRDLSFIILLSWLIKVYPTEEILRNELK